MSLVSTRAVVLHSFPYSESSKIVRLETESLGVQSAIAKGARAPKSTFGGRLQTLSEGVANLYVRPNRELHTLGAFEVTKMRPHLAGDIGKYAAAAALSELVLRFAEAHPQPEIFEHLVTALDRLADAAPTVLDTVALSALWGTIDLLGFGPTVEVCARDGNDLPDGRATFSIADGGFLCTECARGLEGTTLERTDRDTLQHLIVGVVDAVGVLSPRHATAHRRLFMRFVKRHLSEDRELHALSFWESVPWAVTSS